MPNENEDEIFNLTELPTELNEAPRPTDAAIYERQAALELDTSISVAIVGCGGVGVWAALALALAGTRRLVLFDGDSVSLNNLNRLPFTSAAVGVMKSEALANWLQQLRPETELEPRGMFDPQLHNAAINGCNWVICCTDSLKSRRLVYKAAVEQGCSYLELGADGERWTLSPTPPEFTTDLELEAGYQSVPVHVGPCMMAGAAAAYYVLHSTIPGGSHVAQWEQPKQTGDYHWQSARLAHSWMSEQKASYEEAMAATPQDEYEADAAEAVAETAQVAETLRRLVADGQVEEVADNEQQEQTEI